MSNSYPKFAVVGNPNKGKSSIVASLSLDDSIQIGNTPGTTQVKRGFPLKVDGKIIYELFDTPGFQRARAVFAWLEEHGDVSADRRIDVVKQFVMEHRDNPRFKDEVELLEPIINGAGIIYVVDASKPYGAEYEIEMEILRWCGQPSMAILNLIGDEDYREEWSRALGQYFRLVRTYNPMSAGHQEHIELLESMAQLKEEWTKSIKEAIVALEMLYLEKIEQSAEQIVEYMVKTLSYVEKKRIKGETGTKEEEEELTENYRAKIVTFEKEERVEIERIWNHINIEKSEELLALEDMGLFSKESASIFGLTQKELILTAAATGATAGAAIDLFAVGHTLLVGALVGGVVGGVGAMFGFDNLYEVKVLGKSIGKREISVGPMQNVNFPYILLGRALYHASKVAKRSHAVRDSLNLEEQPFSSEIFESSIRKELEKVHVKLRKQEEPKEELLVSYKEVLFKLFRQLLS